MNNIKVTSYDTGNTFYLDADKIVYLKRIKDATKKGKWYTVVVGMYHDDFGYFGTTYCKVRETVEYIKAESKKHDEK